MAGLTTVEMRRLRLRAQALSPSLALTPTEVVTRGIAFQGQALPSVLQALALRSAPGTTVADVRAAFDRGELVRGWTQRGTLFVTTPASYADLTLLTGEAMRRTLPPRREALGITAHDLAAAEAVARELLARGGVTRAELIGAWEAAGIATNSQRGYHLIAGLSHEGLMYWGPFQGAEQRLVATPAPSGDPAAAAIERVARGYLRSHGPVKRDELAWWLGLAKTPIRAALAHLGDEVVGVEVEGEPYLVHAELLDGEPLDPVGVTLVPAFDEAYLGYQDRGAIASAATQQAIVPGNNGMFRPAVFFDGYVIGTWRQKPSKGEAAVELTERVPEAVRRQVDAAVATWPY